MLFGLKEKTIIWFLVVVFAANIILAFVNYGFDLHRQFPGMDLKRMRLGVSSWYSRDDKGIHPRTANNEKFDDQAMTCASWNYPFREKLIVINALNWKWVVCRVNDRGPAKRLNREIDLTKGAFHKISSHNLGLIPIFVIPVHHPTAHSEKESRR